MTLTEELIQTALAAPDDRKEAAILILRGAPAPTRGGARGNGPEPFVGLRDVAAFLGVSPRSVVRWRVPGHKLGSRTRYRLTEAQTYVAGPAFAARMTELREARAEVVRR